MGRKKSHTKREKETIAEIATKTRSHSTFSIKLPVSLLFLFSFLLYCNTIPFEFTLDDKLAISENSFTKKGVAGIPELLTNDMFVGFFGRQKNLVEGGRYRPLSMIMFALEWEFFGPAERDKNKPDYKEKMDRAAHVGHLINALFYGLTAVVIFLVLFKLFPYPEEKKWYYTLPFVVTALWIAHPLHTEVVANVKSRDEIIATAGGFYALHLILNYLENKRLYLLLLSGGIFFLAMSSKESAITFVGVIPLTLLFFRKNQLKKALIGIVPIAIAAIAYMLVRSYMLGDIIKGKIPSELMNDPFLLATSGEKMATITYTLGLYIKLLFLPITLTHDYYPWYPIAEETYQWGSVFPYIHWNNPLAIISLLAYAGLIGFGIFGLVKLLKTGKIAVYAYCILLYLGTFILFSNLFFSIGTFMNERFMYLPSFGFVLALGYFLTENLKKHIKVGSLIFGSLVALYSFKTISRNYAWENDATLAITDAKTSTTSAKVNMSAGGSYLDLAKQETNPIKKQQLLVESYNHLFRSIQLYPTFIQPMILMGTTLFEMKEYDKSIVYYENCMKIDPNYKYTINNLLFLADTLTKSGKYDLAIKSLNTLVTYQPQHLQAYSTLGEIYGKHLGDLDKSLEYISKALEIDPKNSSVLQKMGVIYAIKGEVSTALNYFNSALEIDPDNAYVLLNVGLIYRNSGNLVKGEDYLNRAYALDPLLR